MRQLLLATVMIALPVAGFTMFTIYTAKPAVAITAPAGLGDLSAFKTIIADVQTISATGDFGAAEHRITDFETAWDTSASALRAINGDAWGNIDDAADGALKALRAGTPAADQVATTLASLMATLDAPGQAAASATAGAATLVAGVAVTDANGRALPCEVMIAAVQTALATSIVPQATKDSATEFQTKALERCNADDDAHADAFSAQALSLLTSVN